MTPEDLSILQLQELLAQHQLKEEQSSVNVVRVNTEEKNSLKAIGPTIYLSIIIGGIPVEAMVDTGSQSTIISRSLLHKIGQKLRSQGEPLPVLEKPSSHLFGKDGAGGGRELTITAQLQVKVEADGESAYVLVFVQPFSEQECLLGMNVLPALGLVITRANGEPLITKQESNSKIANIRILKSVSNPSLKGCFVEVGMECVDSDLVGTDVLFEPKLKSYGLDSHESLVKVQDNGLLVQNTDGGCSINLVEGMEIGVLKGITGQIISVECDRGMSSKNGTVVESAKKDSSMTGEKVMGDSVCASVKGERYSGMECSIEQLRERNEGLVESLALPQEKFSDTQFQGKNRKTFSTSTYSHSCTSFTLCG